MSLIMQIAPEGVESNTGIKEVSLWEILAGDGTLANPGIGSSGWLICGSLAIMLGYAVFIFVERYLALRKASKEEQGFLTTVKNHLADGKIDQALAMCARSTSPSARMLEKGIAKLGKPLDMISSTIENQGKFEIMRLEQRVGFLATASGSGPMIGFFGTVVGMVAMFIDLQNATSLSVQVIAPGIMTAMITTVCGLIVGIFAHMGYNYLLGKISEVVYQMENTAIEFLELLDKPGK